MVRLGIIIAATAALAFAAWAQTASAIFSKFSPQLGLQINSNSAAALINITETAGQKNDKAQFKRIARNNALRAFGQEPLSTAAVRQLGQYYALQGDTTKARQLISQAAAMSRRDPATQIWIYEDHLRNGRVGESLGALDILLRTQPDSRDSAFKSFGTLLSIPSFRAVFVDFADKRPPWLEEFIAYSVATVKQPEALSQTLAAIKPFPFALVNDEQLGIVMTELVNKAAIAEARVFYQSIPGTETRLLTSLDVARPGNAFRLPPIGWQVVSDNNGQGFGYVEGTNITIEALAMPGRRATIARKLLFLKPGTYRWTALVDTSGLVDGASASLRLQCNRGPGQWSVSATSPQLRAGRNGWDFAVRADCAAQLLVIEAIGTESQSDATLTISRMGLAPVQGVHPAAATGVLAKKAL